MPKKPSKFRPRTIEKLHIIVRLELANPLLNAIELSKLVGLSPWRFYQLKMSKEYRQIHNQYLSGVLVDLDTQVKETLNMTQETLNFAVPLAMQSLLRQMLQEKDLRIQNKAANDLLDRDGKFAKVTRTGLATPAQGGAAVPKDNDIAADLIASFTATKKAGGINQPPLTETTQ
jgi:hypothetical protein